MFFLISALLISRYSDTFSFIRSSNPSAPPHTLEVTPLDTSRLLTSVHKAFPPDTHRHPAFSSALSLLDALSSPNPPSCQHSATTDFVAECSNLDIRSAHHSEARSQYAVQLAVCEFEATGVQFPDECKSEGVKRDKQTLQRCAKRLEERPQWWTTLSNNIQNAMVVCAAAKHEVDRDNLLNLHRNITRVQSTLFKVVETSIEEVWEALEEQANFKGSWKEAMTTVQQDMNILVADVMGTIESTGKELKMLLASIVKDSTIVSSASLTGLDEIKRVVQDIHEETRELSNEIQKAGEAVDETIEQTSFRYQRGMEKVMTLAQQNGLQITGSFSAAIDDLKRNADALSLHLQRALESSKQLGENTDAYRAFYDSLSISHAGLIESHMSLSNAMQQQEMMQKRLARALEDVTPKFEAMLLSAEMLAKSLNEAEMRVQTLGSQSNVWVIALVFFLGTILVSRSVHIHKLVLIFLTPVVFWFLSGRYCDLLNYWFNIGHNEVIASNTTHHFQLLVAEKYGAVYLNQFWVYCFASWLVLAFLGLAAVVAYGHLRTRSSRVKQVAGIEDVQAKSMA